MGFQSSVNSVIGTVAGLKVADKLSKGAEASEVSAKIQGANLEGDVMKAEENVKMNEKALEIASSGAKPDTNTYEPGSNSMIGDPKGYKAKDQLVDAQGKPYEEGGPEYEKYEKEQQQYDIKKYQYALKVAKMQSQAKQLQLKEFKKLMGGKK